MSKEAKQVTFVLSTVVLFFTMLGLYLGFSYGRWECLIALYVAVFLFSLVAGLIWLSEKIFKE